MKKLIISVTIASILLLGFLTYKQCADDMPNIQANTMFVSTQDNLMFVAQKGNETSCIYQMDSQGKVTRVVSTEKIDMIADKELLKLAYEDGLYALYGNDEVYTLVQFDENIAVARAINTQDFSGNNAGSLEIYENKAYITLLKEENKVATVYELDLSSEDSEFQAVYEMEAPEKRHFVETLFDGESLTARYDNGVDTREATNQGGLTIEPDLKGKLLIALYLNEKTVVFYFVTCFSLLMLIILLLIILFKSNSYGLQRFATVEAILIFILVGSMAINQSTTEKTLKYDKLRYAKYQANFLMDELNYYNKLDTTKEDFCDSEYYQQTYQTLYRYIKQSNSESFVEDAAIISVVNNTYLEEVSVNGFFGKSVRSLGSQDLENLIATTQTQAVSAGEVIQYQGKEYGAWVLTWPGTIAQEKMLLVLVSFDDVISQSRAYLLQLCIYGILLWLIGTALLVVVTYLEFSSVRKLSKTMEAVCQGKQYEFVKPDTMNWDLERMWDSLYEIFKNRERLFYSKNMIFKAFYRFAPKNIEKILGKESIADVKAGDSIEMNAVVGAISMTGLLGVSIDSYIASMNINFHTICKFQTEHEGVILSSDCNLGTMKVLFDNRVSSAVQFGIDTMIFMEESGALKEQNTLILLHQGNLVYGVSGTEKQAFSYMISKEFECLQEYVEPLRDAGVRMTVTEKLQENMGEAVSNRYIGYVELKKIGKNMKLYEILDAYPVNEKKLKMANNEIFQRALSLYYKNDFYLARNTFTDVVKNCPNDQIAKWYLFTCESMLNMADTSNFKYGLFSE